MKEIDHLAAEGNPFYDPYDNDDYDEDDGRMCFGEYTPGSEECDWCELEPECSRTIWQTLPSKIININGCMECPFSHRALDAKLHCDKSEQSIIEESSPNVAPIPSWCPLPSKDSKNEV